MLERSRIRILYLTRRMCFRKVQLTMLILMIIPVVLWEPIRPIQFSVQLFDSVS